MRAAELNALPCAAAAEAACAARGERRTGSDGIAHPPIPTGRRGTAVIAWLLVRVIAALSLLAAFPAHAAPPAAGSTMGVRAWADYQMPDEIAPQRMYSNPVTAVVAAVEGVALSGNARVHVQPGSQAALPYLVTNAGNTASTVALKALNNGAGCVSDSFDLVGPQLVLDSNDNGIADIGEPVVTAIHLEAGQSASLLLVGTVPGIAGGSACLALSATTALQSATAAMTTVAVVDNGAALTVFDTVLYSGDIAAGSTLAYDVRTVNNGVQNATPAATDGTTAATLILVNGSPVRALLLRNPVPSGTTYVAGSLQSGKPSVVKLFRLPGDAPFSYRTVDDATAVEVAVAELQPGRVVPGGALQMAFKATVNGNAAAAIVSRGFANYNDGNADTAVAGNAIALPLSGQTAGAALSSTLPLAQSAEVGKVHMVAQARNYGATTMYDVQLRHPLESASGAGTYVASALPAAGHYTVVPGSLQVTEATDSSSHPVANAAFDGRGAAGTDALLSAPIVLHAGGAVTLEYDVLINYAGWGAARSTQAQAYAARLPGASLSVTDLSQNGLDPDPTGAGPQRSNAPTPLAPMPRLSLQKTAQSLVPLGGGQFDITYVIDVSNVGQVAATRLRLIDNLGCAMAQAGITSWSLQKAPAAARGALLVSGGFTGKETCNAATDAASGAPLSAALALTDGTRDLAPGQSESVSFTVRVATGHPGTLLTNTALAAAQSAAGAITAVTSTSSSVLLTDPQGVVYDSTTRQPVPGAVVTLRRTNCGASAAALAAQSGASTSTASAILPAEVYNSSLAAYRFNADGSLSYTTDETGSYQFFWKTPPVQTLCAYDIQVSPPAGYRVSALIPAQKGVFASCGDVVSQAAAPQGSDPTTWYASFVSGFDTAAAAACAVQHNHVPLDSSFPLQLQKQGDKTRAEFGDFIAYRLTLNNHSAAVLTGLRFVDTLPPGLAYVPGSARLNGAAVADPQGGKGPTLTFDYPAASLPASDKATVVYRVRVGVGAPTEGDVTNRAIAYAQSIESNTAQFRTHISGGAFSDDAYLAGKVYLDCNRDGTQGDDEPGIPGVRLYLEDGRAVMTDLYGRWSLYGLRPITHAIRVDATTLPEGAELAAFSNRNAGAADSRFVDLKKGELGRADFQVVSCSDAVREDVQRRRKALEAKGDAAEIDAAMKTRLAATPTLEQGGRLPVDVRGMAPSGAVGAGGAPAALGGGLSASSAAGAALIRLPSGIVGNAGDAGRAPTGAPRLPGAANPGGAEMLGPLVAPGVVDLETLVEQEDAQAAFLDLKEGDTVASAVFNVRVKGPLGTSLRLKVNGQDIADQRVGKKVSLQSRGIAAWEYIGVELKAGVNELQLDAVDEFGIGRASQTVHVRAPGGLSRLRLAAEGATRADPLKPLTFQLVLSDDAGVPITARTQVTLEADRGAWLEDDLNPLEPGVQINVTGGRAELHYRPPGEPGPVRLRASAGTLVEEVSVRLAPQDRPLQGIGIIEGTLDLTRRGALAIGQAPAGAAFEQELRSGAGIGAGSSRGAARAAFYFKGTVLGEYLLTTAYDSDKRQADRLFRDIKPDEYYPVYGDSAERSYDAQSTGKLYVRIDKDRSYLLLGDFTTASSEEVRKLSQVSRNLNGAKSRIETDDLRLTAFASRDNTVQQVEEIPATGVSFYFLKGSGSFLPGSEKVELVTRLRSQPQVIVATRSLARGTDYTFEPLDKRLLLVLPVASVDTDLNPQSLRVSYEVSTGGPAFTVAGVDLQLKITDRLQVGAVAARDDNPQNRRQLSAVTALHTLGDSTVIAAEFAQSDTDLKGRGKAARVAATYQDGKLKAQVEAQRTSTGFDNPNAGLSGGNEQETYRAEYALDDTTKLRVDGNRSVVQPATAGAAPVEQQSYALSLQKKLTPDIVGRIGLVRGTSTGATSFDYGAQGTDAATGATSAAGAPAATGAAHTANTMIQAGLSARVPGLPQAQVFGEVGQDVRDRSQREASLGASYALTEKTRLYGRYDYLSAAALNATLNGGQASHGFVFGIDSAYMEGGRVYDEARLGAGGVRNAAGVRNSFKLGEAWSLTGGIEHTVNGTGTTAGKSTSDAITVGALYAKGAWRGNTAAEYHRQSDGSSSSLYSLGLAYKLSPDWAVLGRSTATRTSGNGAGAHLIEREQVGFAWRPAERNDLNALFRFENRHERLGSNASGTAAAADGVFDAAGTALLPGDYRTQVVTAVANYSPHAGLEVTGRYAAKRTRYVADGGAGSYWAQLLHIRATQDLNASWDIGVQAGLMLGQGGARQTTVGVEAGYQLVKNIWVSAGYNFVGLRDPDLTGNDYTSRGAFLRLRLKFDETGLLFGDKAPRRAAAGATGAADAGPRLVTKAAPSPAVAAGPGDAQRQVGVGSGLWTAGMPLCRRMLLSASALFDGDSDARLSASGLALLQGLANRIGATPGRHDVDISVGRGDIAGREPAVWAARAAALRDAMHQLLPTVGRVSIEVDTQPASPDGGFAVDEGQGPGDAFSLVVLASGPALAAAGER
ncbi:hypothetical protein [Roseateles sp.]|uniref:hypothetical protein n=1 Tax=Roseateles sp. TaxID=1971397 RepID=UPI002DFCD4BC|nr:hypothetical protein [Roseateles sp.]